MSIQVRIGRDSDGELTSTEATEGRSFDDSNSRKSGSGLATKPPMGVTRVVLNGGNIVSSETVNTKINTADIINDRRVAAPDSVLASRRTQGGSPSMGAGSPTDLVNVGGMEITVAQAIQFGYLKQDAVGGVSDAMSLSEITPDAQSAFDETAVEEPVEVFSSETLEAIREGTTGLPEAVATQRMMQALSGEIDGDQFRRELEASGQDAEAVAGKFDAAVEGIILDITDQLGLNMEDEDETLDNFFNLIDALKDEDRMRTTSAMRSVITIGDATELVDLIQKVHQKTGMLDADTLKGGGYETKIVNGVELMKVEDNGSVMWVTQQVARRLGAI